VGGSNLMENDMPPHNPLVMLERRGLTGADWIIIFAGLALAICAVCFALAGHAECASRATIIGPIIR